MSSRGCGGRLVLTDCAPGLWERWNCSRFMVLSSVGSRVGLVLVRFVRRTSPSFSHFSSRCWNSLCACSSESMICSFIVRFLWFFPVPLYGKLCGKTLNLVSLVSSSMENGTGGGALLIEGKNRAATSSRGGNVKQVYTRCCGSSPVKIAFVAPVPVTGSVD